MSVASSSSRQDTESGGAGSRPTIVVVEEDEALARALVRALAWKHYDARSVASAIETAELIAVVQPSLIILDLLYPDALATCGVEEVHLKTVPVLILSHNTSSEMRHTAIHAGANAFLMKPYFDLAALYGLISALLIRHDATPDVVDLDPLEGIFEVVEKDCRPFVEELVRRRGVSHSNGAEERVDDVLLAAWQAVPAHVVFDDLAGTFRLDWPEPDIKSWLTLAAMNVCNSGFRADGRYDELLAKYERLLAAGLERQGPRVSAEGIADLRDFLEAGLRHLSERDRALLEYRYYVDATPAEVAARFGIAKSTAKNIASACLKDIRKILNARWLDSQ